MDERAAEPGESSEPEESEEAVRAALSNAWAAGWTAEDDEEDGQGEEASARPVPWAIAVACPCEAGPHRRLRGIPLQGGLPGA
jgi:hypothetical protein